MKPDTGKATEVRPEVKPMRDRRFQLKIKGQNVSPETVSVGDLLDAVRRLELAAQATAHERGADGDMDLKLSLVGVSHGSDLLTLAASGPMVRSVGAITKAVRDDDYKQLPRYAVAQLRKMWERAREAAWEGYEFLSDGNGIVPVEIRADESFLPLQTYEEPHTIYGTCFDIGGKKKPTAKVQLMGERGYLTVLLPSKAFAAKISDHLYKPIGLEGVATWDYATRTLVSFVARAVTEFAGEFTSALDVKQDIVGTFDRLAAAAGNRWDDVDPDEYVRELRRD